MILMLRGLPTSPSTCLQLVRDGWLVGPEDGEAPTGVTRMRNPADPKAKDPVMVAGERWADQLPDRSGPNARQVHTCWVC
jgi:hypothetical protein